MKHVAKLTVIAVLMVLGAQAARYYNSADNAAMNCHEVQNALASGYTMQSCVANPIYYFVAPTGAYEWGTVQVELRADPLMGVPPLSITCHIEARDRSGKMEFKETHNRVLIPIR